MSCLQNTWLHCTKAFNRAEIHDNSPDIPRYSYRHFAPHRGSLRVPARSKMKSLRRPTGEKEGDRQELLKS